MFIAIANLWLFLLPLLGELTGRSSERHVSMLPIIGNIAALAACLFGFGAALPTSLALFAFFFDFGGLPWFVIWTWGDDGVWSGDEKSPEFDARVAEVQALVLPRLQRLREEVEGQEGATVIRLFNHRHIDGLHSLALVCSAHDESLSIGFNVIDLRQFGTVGTRIRGSVKWEREQEPETITKAETESTFESVVYPGSLNKNFIELESTFKHCLVSGPPDE